VQNVFDAAPLTEARARKAERARIAAILRSPEAQGSMPRALAMALDSDVTAEEAINALAASGASSAYAETVRQMAAQPQPRFGNRSAPEKPGASWDDVHAATAKQMGIAPRQ
jgi:hypothetical protein